MSQATESSTSQRQRPGHQSWRRATVLAAMIVVGVLQLPSPGTGASAASSTQPDVCGSPERHQFDFWIGKWDVTNTVDQKPAGSSVIEQIYGGCVLRENWSEPGFTGGSLNAYHEIDRKWHQTWTDSTGAWREFVGGMIDSKMILVARHPSAKLPGVIVQERMIFTPNPDGSVRQYSDQTRDGTHWVLRYDYTYRHAGH